MTIDWGNGLVAGAIAILGIAAAEIRSSARYGQRVVNLERDRDEHAETLKEHADKFDELPTRFVPRVELEQRLTAIERNSGEGLRLLKWVLYYRQLPSAAPVPMPPIPPAIEAPEA